MEGFISRPPTPYTAVKAPKAIRPELMLLLPTEAPQKPPNDQRPLPSVLEFSGFWFLGLEEARALDLRIAGLTSGLCSVAAGNARSRVVTSDT